MRKRDFSIRANLALLILCAAGLSVLLASIGFTIYERNNYRAGAVRELTALADTLGANTAASLAFDDPESARQMLNALATEPHVQAAGLYDNEGNLFADYRARKADWPFAATKRWRQGDGYWFDHEGLHLSRGVSLDGVRVGSIVLMYDLKDFQVFLTQYAKISGLVFLFSILVAFAASLRLARSISDPLVDLAAVAKRVTVQKNYSVRAAIRAGGETGFLIRAFNEMLAHIESREEALNSALEKLEQSEERYALAAQGSNDGLWDWNLTSNEIYFSPRWNRMFGFADNDLWAGPEAWFGRIHPGDHERVHAEIAKHRDGNSPEFVSEYRMRHKTGNYIWVLSRGLAIRDQNGRAIRMAGSQTDITEGKIADPLTGIPNRLYFLDRLQDAIETSQREGTHFAVLFIDLDGFKLVNDSLGHSAGDELLIDVAGRLRSSIRTGTRQDGSGHSVVARIGGDEFAIMTGWIQHRDDVVLIAMRIQDRLREPIYFEGRKIFVSASIGIALGASGEDPEELLRNADTAMYAAKSTGKARFEFYTEGLRAQTITRFETETDLRKAIEGEQLVAYYQPIVSMDRGQLHGFEALVRWNHPERGLILPGNFILVAEESDLIVQLGRWILRESCKQLATWQKGFASGIPLTVSVNVSSRQLADPAFIEHVKHALDDSGLSPGSLALEMTESSIMGDAEQTLATLNQLKALGVLLEIDDFGTGYSSLSYLQRLPFDVLKIDRSFVRDIAASSGSLSIVKAITELAHNLNLQVIAEGVETVEQLSKLCELGCDLCQGFLFSKPIAAAAVDTFYQDNLQGKLAVQLEALHAGR